MLFAVALPFLALGPGHFLVRGARLRPGLHLIAAEGLGLLAIFLAGFLAFNAMGSPKGYLGVLLVAAVLTLMAIRGLWPRLRRARKLAFAFLAFYAAMVVLTLPLRHLAGGSWIIDWHEHYSRSLFFLGKLPPTFQFGSGYALPARPPLQNLLCAVAMAQGPDSSRFMSFQLASAALAAVVLLPCVHLARSWSRGRVSPWLMAAVLLLTPTIVIQALYPWTKLLTGFFVLSGLALYLQTYRRASFGRMAIVAALLAGGILTHYSAVPYALLIAGHFLVATRSLAKVVGPLVVAGVLLLPWFGWSVRTFGVRTTFASNSTAIESGKSGAMANLPGNTLRTLVPHPLLMTPTTFFEGTGLPKPDDEGFRQPSRLGRVRDYLFLAETSVLPLSFGLAGLLLLIPRLPVFFRGKFWRFFLPAAFGLALLIHPTPSLWGIAHVTMLPLTLLGVTRIAVELRRRDAAVWPVRCGLVLLLIDALLLTFPHVIAQARVFNIRPLANDLLGQVIPDAETLSSRAVSQYQFKVADGIVMLGDRLSVLTPLLLLASLVLLLGAWAIACRAARATPHRS